MADEPQVVWHQQSVTPTERSARNKHRACVLWFTGLSGSGKSTIANLVDRALFERGVQTYLLDGDNVRHGLCAGPNILAQNYPETFAKRFGLGFGQEDREENIRRVGAVTELLTSAGLMCLTAFVSPYRRDRDLVRQWVNQQNGQGSFIEIFVNTPLEVCMQRDPKGLYKQAVEGKIKNFTGVSDPYEAPEAPELELKTDSQSAERSASQVIEFLESYGALS